MKIILVTLLTLIPFVSKAQIKLDEKLKIELRKINEDDQYLRRIYFIQKVYDSKSDSLKKVFNVDDAGLKKILVNKIKQNDSLNLIKIERIIKEHGYPGTSLVGPRENDVVWAVIQHASPEIMKKYLPILKKAVGENEIEFTKYALTLDRVLMAENKPQIYGSQAKTVKLVGSSDPQLIIWPIENAKAVDKLRRKVGFYESVRKYAKGMGIKYKEYLMEDIDID